ncbi:hypothetical protein EJK15_59950 [Nonomuraea basaltis]|nr:hypothetical protein EJK15_59950 [Nonomuraea basaltis]
MRWRPWRVRWWRGRTACRSCSGWRSGGGHTRRAWRPWPAAGRGRAPCTTRRRPSCRRCRRAGSRPGPRRSAPGASRRSARSRRCGRTPPAPPR